MTKPNAKARAQRKYEAQYRDPIQVKAGESVEVEVDREDAAYPGWLWCRARDGRQGWMPVELLSRQRPFAIVLEGYSAKELTVQPGDELGSKRSATVGLWSEMLRVNSDGSRNPTFRRELPACFLLPICGNPGSNRTPALRMLNSAYRSIAGMAAARATLSRGGTSLPIAEEPRK
jgi:hypothetical protein